VFPHTDGVSFTKFVLCTRDKNISKRSRGYTNEEHKRWIEANRKIIYELQAKKYPYMFFSYETLLLYRNIYLQELYRFVGASSNFLPPLIDGNRKYLRS
jgi:hypothetical protein